MIRVIENWGQGGENGAFLGLDFVEDDVRDPLQYQWAKNYRVDEYTEPTTALCKKRLTRASGKHEGKIAVPM